MGVTLFYGFYPSKCNDKEILPYLDVDSSYRELNGKHLEVPFYDNCRELATFNEDSNCYIFEDFNNLFEFAQRKETPVDMDDYICMNYQSNLVFIIWVR